MFVMTKMVLTTTERGEPYYTELAVAIPDRKSVGRTSAVPSDTEGSEVDFDGGSSHMHSKGSKPELAGGRQSRQIRVRFRMPAYIAGHNSGEEVRGEREDRL
ncbi:hypothetical protein Ddye_015575 [Dipteronia dyeriana]|uniref:Uncharacterized protein n=1 Tax=Dipteronia dyeriana TaxID=168575 RepID=A0AAD9U536_9ROSI|nr:hypothetical protein Ddye_015575 [Dipteronia dyeriana]